LFSAASVFLRAEEDYVTADGTGFDKPQKTEANGQKDHRV